MNYVKFIGSKSDELHFGLSFEYALFKDKNYIVLYESDSNYLIINETGSSAIVPKNLFEKTVDNK